jgi:hypothetical protein
LAATFAVLLCAANARAEDCTLHRVGSLELKPLDHGELGVDVVIAGKPQTLVLGLSNPFSYLVASYADKAGFAPKNLPDGVVVNVGHGHATGTLVVPDLRIGATGGKNIHFLRVEDSAVDDHPANGLLGLDVLSSLDVELDFANNRANLYAQDHCPGKVVYWTAFYAALPFRTDETGHPSFHMELDGKRIKVAFDLVPGHARMGMLTAKRLFDIDETSPGVEAIAVKPPEYSPIHRYPFKALSADGIAIANPQIDLFPQTAECRPFARYDDPDRTRCLAGADLRIGLDVLRQLHLYFAFKEKVLYVTPAGAH